MNEFGGDAVTKLGAGIAALGASLYGLTRLLKSDRRDDRKAEVTDDAMTQVIQTLRDEVGRLAERLARVEEENRRCEERNAELHAQLLQLKQQLHLA